MMSYDKLTSCLKNPVSVLIKDPVQLLTGTSIWYHNMLPHHSMVFGWAHSGLEEFWQIGSCFIVGCERLIVCVLYIEGAKKRRGRW